MRSGTLAISWGPANAGAYISRNRICLWRVAITRVPNVEIDDMMRSHLDVLDARAAWAKIVDAAARRDDLAQRWTSDRYRAAIRRINGRVPGTGQEDRT